MNFFPRLVLAGFCLLFSQTPSFGMGDGLENPHYKSAVTKIFNILSEKARALRAHGEVLSDVKKNKGMEKSLKIFVDLDNDLNAAVRRDNWLGNFGLSKDERTALQEPYKGLCQKISAAARGHHHQLEDFSFSTSFHMLNELRGSCVLDKKIQEDAFFMAAFYDLLTFKRQKGEMILAGLYNTQDYLNSIDYQEIFIETYQSLLMLNEMRKTSAPPLEVITTNIRARIDRDFDRQVFSESDVKKIQKATIQKVEEWFKDQKKFKEIDLPGTNAQLRGISDWPKISLMGVSLGKSHLLQFRDFVQNLSAELNAHFKFVRDLLKENVLSPDGRASAVFEFLIDDLKRSLIFPPTFRDLSFKVPLDGLIKEEIGLINYEVRGSRRITGDVVFDLQNTEYQIFPEMVRTFRDFVWPLIPRNVRVDDLTKPDYVPIYSYFRQAEMNALHAQIKALSQENTRLRGIVSDQRSLVERAKAKKADEEAQKAADELLSSEEGAKGASKTKGKSKKSSSNGVAGPASDVPEKVASIAAQSSPPIEYLTKMTENLRKELGKKNQKLATLQAAEKQSDQEHHQLNLRLCQLLDIEVTVPSEVLRLMTLKLETLKKTVTEQEACLKSQATRLEELSHSSAQKPNKDEKALKDLQTSLREQSQELDHFREEARKHEKEKADHTRKCIQEISRVTGLKAKEGASFQDVSLQIKAQLESLKKTIEDQRRGLDEKEALFQKASLREKAQGDLARKVQELEKVLTEKATILERSETLQAQQAAFSGKEQMLNAKIAQLEEAVQKVGLANSAFQKEAQEKDTLLKAQVSTIETLTQQRDKNQRDFDSLKGQLSRERDLIKTEKSAQHRNFLAIQSTLQSQITALTAELSDLKQRASHSVSKELFDPMKQKIFELTGEIMRFISEIMTGTTPIDVSKLEGNFARLQDVYWRANQMLPPDQQFVQSPYPRMMRPVYPSGPMIQYPQSRPYGYPNMAPYSVGYRGPSYPY